MDDVNLDRIRKLYSEMEDFEIVHIATKDAFGLRKEVIGIIVKEIEKRNLNIKLIDGLVAQNKEYTIEQLVSYAYLLQNLICPHCFTKNGKLNGVYLEPKRSKSSLFKVENKIIVACSKCIKRESLNALVKNLFFGFLKNPIGLISAGKTIKNFIDSRKSIKTFDTPNQALVEFTGSYIGTIEMNKDEPNQLQQIINIRYK